MYQTYTCIYIEVSRRSELIYNSNRASVLLVRSSSALHHLRSKTERDLSSKISISTACTPAALLSGPIYLVKGPGSLLAISNVRLEYTLQTPKFTKNTHTDVRV